MGNSLIFRKRFFRKIAQMAEGTTVPTTSSVANKQIPPPPIFQASASYPDIRRGFNSASVNLIDQLVNMLNIATHYATGGEINFQVLRNNGFNFDASVFPSPDQRNLILFSKEIFNTLLNHGNAFPDALSTKEISDMVDNLRASVHLNNLSNINPTGPIARQIPGNLKTTISNYLSYLKNYNPVV